jgi:hypothetical protein
MRRDIAQEYLVSALRKEPVAAYVGCARYWRAMSQENVELIDQVNDAFKRGDLDAFLALNHADVEFTPLNAAR